MKKLIILSLLLLTGCRTVMVDMPDGGKVTVFTFGMDTKIGHFEGHNSQGIQVEFNDLASNPNEVMINKLIDKIPTPTVVPIP